MSSETKNIVEFTLIYNRYKVQIYNYVINMTKDNDLAEDIVQNVFMKLFENIKNKKSIAFWIFKTARNDLYKHFRKKRIIREKSEIIEESILANELNDVSEIYELKEINGIVMRLLDDYPEEQKETYLLRESGGLSYQEIASVTEVDEKTVKSRLYDVRQKLIKKLSKVI